MAPATLILDNTSDFAMPAKAPQRTLLLAPPTLASDEALLKTALGPHDRSTSDLHMLDRLSAGLVALPPSTYDLVLLLAGADSETAGLLNRNVLGSVHDALKPGGRIDGDMLSSVGEKEFVLAGLVGSGNGFLKPDYGEVAVPLKLRRKKKEEKAEPPKVEENKVPAGVGFVSLDDLDGDDDELIDEATLLSDEDLKRPLNIRMYYPVVLTHFYTYPPLLLRNLDTNNTQLRNVCPRSASGAGPARTARAASLRGLRPRRRAARLRPTRSCAR